MKVIITGATGMVGEGVLLECINNTAVAEILVISRKTFALSHSKLKVIIVPNFIQTKDYAHLLSGYDACFYCAGISSIGINEANYTIITYDTTLAFAKTLLEANPNIILNFISGRHTDSSEKGKIMWARVKGKAENALKRMDFRAQYNFRPGLMIPTKGQKNIKLIYSILAGILRYIIPATTLTLEQIGQAMINAVSKGYHKNILEVNDIRKLAK